MEKLPEETPKPKETILKTKETKQKKQLTDEAREALAMRMREINDKRILETAEKIKKTKGVVPIETPKVPEPAPAPTPEPEPPKPSKKKRVIKVIELSDSEEEEEEPQVIAIRKTKPKKVPTPVIAEPEHLEKPKQRKPRTPKPTTPTPIIQSTPEPPRGRFL